MTIGMHYPAELAKAALFLRNSPDVAFAYLFGSRAAGAARSGSDADIAVMFRRPLAPESYLRFYSRLADAVQPFPLDLVPLNDAPDSLAGRVIETRIILADKTPSRRKRYEMATLRRFFDFREREKAILERKLRAG